MSWRALGLALLLAPRSLLADTPYVDAQLRTRPSGVEVFQETVNPTPRYLGRSDRFALPAAGSQIRLLLKAPGYADTRLVPSPGYFVNHTTYPERGEVQLPPRTWQAVGQSWWLQLLGLLAGLTGIGAWRRLRVRRQRAGTTAMVAPAFWLRPPSAGWRNLAQPKRTDGCLGACRGADPSACIADAYRIRRDATSSFCGLRTAE